VPVAVVRIGDQLRNLDADGVIFGDRGRQPGNLPMVETTADASSDALREAAAVAGVLEPALLATVDHLEVATVDQITLVLRDGRIERWGSAEQSAEKAEVLSALLSRRAEVYDVSVPGSPTTGPQR
jgi:cell division protein FtsQ